ncbi:MAG: macrolide ABC transporter permease/ATP-binding protein MacB, partial [Marinomonas sp.]
MDSKRPLLSIEQVSRHYRNGDSLISALDGVSLTVHEGEFVAIMGQSGSGKSTLMNIIGCLDQPSEGRYLINGHDVNKLNTNQLAALRLKTFGFVFQRYQLLPTLNAQENVALPALYANTAKEQRLQKAMELLQKLGLKGREHHKPSELSGGQQQRVSIARALINGAEVILADEPTGALDSKSSEQVLALLSELND